MSAKRSLRFSGTDGPVLFDDADDVIAFLPEIFCNWPFEEVEPADDSACLLLSRPAGKFEFSSNVYDLSKSVSDPLNAACTLLAELAWARIRDNESLLCFHGAAVEIDGSLVLFPNKRRAGKSTLTACLAAQGVRVFTDDYLPLRLSENGALLGLANGAAPRLRVPLPKEFSPELVNWIDRHAGPGNRQYLYLNLSGDQLANHGEALPISKIILLERSDKAGLNLSPVGSAEVMRRLIYQNFSRCMNPARVLAMINAMVETSECLQLDYRSGEEAATFLIEWFANNRAQTTATANMQIMPEEKLAVLTTSDAALTASPYVRTRSSFEARYGDEVFAASSDGPGLHHFEGVTTGIWNMLSEPSTQAEISEALCAAFTEEPVDRVSQGVSEIMQAMLTQRLIEPAEPA